MDYRSAEVESQTGYLSYLLRLWREGEERAGWRASLHDPRSGERVVFASLDELFTYLQGQIGAAAGRDEGMEKGGGGPGVRLADRGPRHIWTDTLCVDSLVATGQKLTYRSHLLVQFEDGAIE